MSELDVGALYTAQFTRIQRYIAHRIDNWDEAEDLTSEVFVRVIVAADQWVPRNDTPVIVWLLAIARNLTTDYLRKRIARPSALELDPERLIESYDPTAQLELQEQRAWLQQARQRLTDAQRAVLALRFGPDELSPESVARVLGMSNGAVRERQRLAVERLRKFAMEGPHA